ncbi:MAG: SLC13 family permease [Planctomycetota bacterium]
MTGIVLAIFALTYALIVTRRLRWLPIGRSAGALLGAVLMVAAGALTPAESYAAVDHDTLVLLLGMMLVTAYLDRGGFFREATALLVRGCRTPRGLLLGVSVASGALSALLVNDAVCLFLTPLVVRLCLSCRLPLGPFLLAVATSANLGSAATLVGNPQTMLIGSLSGIGFARYAWLSLPAVLVGWTVNAALLWALFGRRLPPEPLALTDPEAARAEGPAPWLSVAVLVGLGAAFLGGLHLGYVALGAALVFMIADRDEPTAAFAKVDWQLLVFFSGLFVVVAALQRTGLVAQAWEALAPHMRLDRTAGVLGFTAGMTVGANTVSNVPLVLLVGPQLGELGGERELAWVLLGYVTTVAGNLTLIGSVANLIVAERAREHYTLGFWEYLRFGAVSTVACLALGVPLLVLWSRAVG